MVKYPFKCIYMSWIFRNRRGGKVSRLTPSSVKTNCTKYSNVFRKQHSSFRRYVKDHVYAPECIRKTSSVCLRRSVRTCRRSSSFFIVHKVNLKNCEGAAAEPSCPAFYAVSLQTRTQLCSDSAAAAWWIHFNLLSLAQTGGDSQRARKSVI